MEQRIRILELLSKLERILKIECTIEEKMGLVDTLIDPLNAIRDYVTVTTYDEMIKKLEAVIEYNAGNSFSETEFLERYNDMAGSFSEFKDDYINNKTNKVKISFVIPTARAFYAKIATEAILKYEGDEIEVVVSHNYLNEMTEMNTVVIDDKRFKYFRRENVENAQGTALFSYNILNGISKATGDYVFLLSDKDIVDIRIIPHLISAIQNNRDISVLSFCRGDRVDNFIGQYQVFTKGDEAIFHAYIQFVLTGLVYKKSLINIDHFYNKINGDDVAYLFYTHVYLFIDLCKLGNYIEFNEAGHDRPKIDYPNFEKIGDKITEAPIYEYKFYAYSLNNRIKAFQGLSALVYENITDKSIFLKFMITLIGGYFIMITEHMYLVYPKEKWLEIDMRQNATTFKEQNEIYFAEFIKEAEILHIVNDIMTMQYGNTMQRIEIMEQTGKVPL